MRFRFAMLSLVFLAGMARLAASSLADDPRPMPGPEPIPPLGPVAPDLPVASIEVADVSGREITSSADLSKLLIVSSAKSVHGSEVGSLLWIVDAEPPAIIEHWTTDDGHTLIVNTGTVPTNLKLLQIAAKGDRAAYQRVLIKIGQGDIPPPVPPGPGPGPGPKPEPSPGPTADGVRLSVLADVLRTPVGQAMLLNQRDLWKEIPGAVWPRNDWSISDPSPRATELVEAAEKAGVKVPALFIDDAESRKNLAIVPLPEKIEDLRAIVGRYVKPPATGPPSSKAGKGGVR